MLSWMSEECESLGADNSRELWEVKIAILSSMVLLCEQPVKRFAKMSLGGETKMERQKHFSDGGRPGRCFRCIVEAH
jgi:hypothetical protein